MPRVNFFVAVLLFAQIALLGFAPKENAPINDNASTNSSVTNNNKSSSTQKNEKFVEQLETPEERMIKRKAALLHRFFSLVGSSDWASECVARSAIGKNYYERRIYSLADQTRLQVRFAFYVDPSCHKIFDQVVGEGRIKVQTNGDDEINFAFEVENFRAGDAAPRSFGGGKFKIVIPPPLVEAPPAAAVGPFKPSIVSPTKASVVPPAEPSIIWSAGGRTMELKKINTQVMGTLYTAAVHSTADCDANTLWYEDDELMPQPSVMSSRSVQTRPIYEPQPFISTISDNVLGEQKKPNTEKETVRLPKIIGYEPIPVNNYCSQPFLNARLRELPACMSQIKNSERISTAARLATPKPRMIRRAVTPPLTASTAGGDLMSPSTATSTVIEYEYPRPPLNFTTSRLNVTFDTNPVSARLSAIQSWLEQLKNGSEKSVDCRELAELPNAVVCIFKDLATMNLVLARASKYAEGDANLKKRQVVDGYKDYHAANAKMNGLATGFDLKSSDLMDFYTELKEGCKLGRKCATSFESDFFDQFVLGIWRLIPGDFSLLTATRGGLETLTHEIAHGFYFNDPYYRAITDCYWDHYVSDNHKSTAITDLSKAYGVRSNSYLLRNEFQAFMVSIQRGARIENLRPHHRTQLLDALIEGGFEDLHSVFPY